MTDDQLAASVCPDDPALGLRYVQKLTPEKRATVERLCEAADEIELWHAGLGAKPEGVILCGPRQIKAGGKPEHKTVRRSRP